MGKGSKEVTVGYKYYVGMHFVLCHGPVDNVSAVWVDERLAWSGANTGGTISISQADLFGGEKREGGISGNVTIAMGDVAQTTDSYLVSKLGAAIPAFRGVVSAILNQVYIGTNPYLKPWKFRVTRIQKGLRGNTQWYSAKAAIGQDMNPIHIIREALTNPEWGMGYGDGDMGTSFTTAADTLYSESFGLSFLWTRETAIEDFIKMVISHIDGALYVDRTTGKFEIKMIRGDYSLGSLLLLDESNVEMVEDFSSSAVSELVNCVTVNYWDASTGKDSSVTAQDISMINAQGATINSTIRYDGVTNGTLAAKLAARDLRTMSNPIIRCTITTNRAASSLNIGDAFKLTWPDYGATNLVMRVVGLALGTTGDGKIKITAVQDVFGLTNVTFVPPGAIEWTDPIHAPADMPYRYVKELPYYELVRQQGQSEIDTALSTQPLAGWLVATGVPATSDTINAEMYVDSGSGYNEVTLTDFCPSATLNGALSISATSCAIQGTFNLDLLSTGTLCQIDNEIMVVTGFTSTTLTVGRGALDTVPVAHSSGARVYFWQGYGASDGVEYVSGDNINVKMLPTTGKGTLAIGSASANTVAFAGRAIRPYPPGQWKIAGNYFPVQLLDTAVSTTWAHRHRTQQTAGNVLNFYDGTVGPETGTTYSFRLYNHDTSNLMYTVDGVTGTSYSTFPSPTGHFNMRLEMWSVRDGYASTYKHSHVFDYYNVTYINDESLLRLVTEDGLDQLTTE